MLSIYITIFIDILQTLNFYHLRTIGSNFKSVLPVQFEKR